MKSLIIFDLDGTLAESKSDLDGEMASFWPVAWDRRRRNHFRRRLGGV